jgi:LysR family transcriptional regulator for metE and metH
MIDLVHLRILRALHQQGSLAAAASALHLTQSALSHSIRKLEHQYSLQIWQREGRKLRLTQAGQYLLRLGEQVLPMLDQAHETLQAYSEGKRGKLRIGMECHPCYEWLLTVVEPFLRRWPDVDLDVIQRFRFNGLEALQNHHIDMLITSDPIQDSGLVNTGVFDYELQLVVAAEHPFASRPRIEPRDLQAQTLFTFPVTRDRLDVYTRFLMPAGMEPKRREDIETVEIMLQLVAANRGVCTLPGWLVERFQEHYPVKGLPLGREGVHKTLYLVYRQEDADVAYVQDFVTLGGA